MAFLGAVVAAAALFLFMAYAIRLRMLRPADVRLRNLAPARADVSDRDDADAPVLRGAPSSIPLLARALGRSSLASTWAFDIDRAGVNLRVGEYFAIRVMFGLVGFTISLLALRSALGFVIGLIAAALGYMLPSFWLKLRVRSRLGKIDAQVVETVELIGNGVRAGFAFSQSIAVASQRVGPPMSVELNRMLLDINLGASTEDALRAMNERIGSDDIDIVVTALLIQRTTGGNLAEMLDKVTETMRDRERVQGEIKTLTSQQRLTAWILSLWPVVLGLIFFAISPSMMKLMFTTTAGNVMIVTWAILTVTAAFIYSRILGIDV